jgi:DNA-binding MarR family transcriptional regulator/GNAT superfamily N-acetyltransferase
MSVEAVLRRFNRAWSQRVGVLDESFLGSGRPIGPSRLLFELGPASVSVRQLRDRTGLDSGYVSRLLRRLEREGLVRTEVDPGDARRRLVSLTAEGRLARQDLDDRSERLARDLVAPLSDGQRSRLAEALDSADRLLRAATIVIAPDDPESVSAQLALTSYYDELARRFDDGFDPGEESFDAFRPPEGAMLLAMSDGEPVACGCVQRLDDRTAEIKRMWVHPGWRGAGLGGRMLRALEQAAADHGRAVVRLDTNRVLTDAVSMYRRAGYTEIPRYNDNPYAHHWFEKSLAHAPTSDPG